MELGTDTPCKLKMSVGHVLSMSSSGLSDTGGRRNGMYFSDTKKLEEEFTAVTMDRPRPKKPERKSSLTLQRSKSVPRLFGKNDNNEKGSRIKTKRPTIKKLTRKFSQDSILSNPKPTCSGIPGLPNKPGLQVNKIIQISSGGEENSGSSLPQSPSALTKTRSFFRKGKEKNKDTHGNTKSSKFINTFNSLFSLDYSPRASKEELHSNGYISYNQFSSTLKLDAVEKAKLRHSRSLPDLLDLSSIGTNDENNHQARKYGLSSRPRRKLSENFLGGLPRKLRRKYTKKRREDKTDCADSNVDSNESLPRSSPPPIDKSLSRSAEWQSGTSLPEIDLHRLLSRRKHRERVQRAPEHISEENQVIVQQQNQVIVQQEPSKDIKNDIDFYSFSTEKNKQPSTDENTPNRTVSESDATPVLLSKLGNARLKEIVDEEIQNILKDKEYDSENANHWCGLISEVIKGRLQHLTNGLFKIVVQVFIGAVAEDGIFSSMHSNWSPNTDNFVSSSYRNKSLFVLASVLAIDFSVPLHGPRSFDNRLYSEVHDERTTEKDMPCPV